MEKEVSLSAHIVALTACDAIAGSVLTKRITAGVAAAGEHVPETTHWYW
jgi:hypothetical protein